MSKSSNPVVIVLDTSAGSSPDTGVTQTLKFDFLKLDVPTRLSISLGSGDSVVVEGKSEAADDFVTIHTWSGGDEVPIDVWLPMIWRARRSVDGAVGESVVKIENRFGLLLEVDE